MQFKLIILLVVVLLIAAMLQTRGQFEGRPSTNKPDLRAAMACEVPDWKAQDLPIGETEEVRNAAAKTLRYDDYFYRSYRRGGVEFTVYVAYWGPGKYPPQMITQHTPDRCWTLNGMTCEETRFDLPVSIGGKPLWPAQWRKFRAPQGGITYTMFWHMVGDRPYDFGKRFYDMPSPVNFWSEALRFAAGSQPAQLFFRITSNVSPEKIWNEPGFQQAVGGFHTLGLGQHSL